MDSNSHSNSKCDLGGITPLNHSSPYANEGGIRIVLFPPTFMFCGTIILGFFEKLILFIGIFFCASTTNTKQRVWGGNSMSQLSGKI